VEIALLHKSKRVKMRKGFEVENAAMLPVVSENSVTLTVGSMPQICGH
jgi:hypothetical protein